MHAAAQFIADAFAPLRDCACFLAAALAQLSCSGASSNKSFCVAAFVTASLALAIGCSAWAIVERLRRSSDRSTLLAELGRSQHATHLRNAILESLPEATLVLRANSNQTLSFRKGSELFGHCLAGPDAPALANAMNELLARGKAFALKVRTIGIREILVRGRPIGDGSAVFLHPGGDEVVDLSVREGTRSADRGAVDVALQGSNGKAPKVAVQQGKTANAEFLQTEPASRLAEGTIVVGADGRLKQHSAEFAEQWLLGDDDLQDEPHVLALAERCAANVGCQVTWEVIASATMANDPERHSDDWGPLIRADGRETSLRMSRLSDGSTLIAFSDVDPPQAQRSISNKPIAMAA